MCVTDRHDMTLVVKVALNLNTISQSKHMTKYEILEIVYDGRKRWVQNSAF